jgi:phage shock protein A
VAAAVAAVASAAVGAAAAGPGAVAGDQDDGPALHGEARGPYRIHLRERQEDKAMAQTSILGRISQLIRANINAILDSAEDPEKMLDQLVLDFTNNIAEAEEAAAQTIGNLRMIEDDAREARAASADWLDKAKAASRRADQLRAEGNTAEADRFDELAKVALRRQVSYDAQATTLETQVASQTELADKLKDGLNKLRVKREELVQKRDELVSRAKMAQAQSQVQESLKSVNVMDPTSEIARYEERIRRQEALVRGRDEVAASSIDEQFASLDDEEGDLEIDARLAELKSAG